MLKKKLSSAESNIPFVLNEDVSYDFMRGGDLFPSNYREVSCEDFEKAYNQALSNLTRSIAAQGEKQLESGFKIDQVTLNLAFRLDSGSGRIGLDGAANIEVVLKPAHQAQVLEISSHVGTAV